MDWVSFDRGLAIAGSILAIVLVVLDKAGKLRGPVLFGLLAIAAAMTLPLVFSVPWVAQTSGTDLFARRLLMVCLVGTVYSLLCVWIAGDMQHIREEPANVPSSNSAKPGVEPDHQSSSALKNPSPSTENPQHPTRVHPALPDSEGPKAQRTTERSAPIVVQPGAVASFGQQGGITAGQVIVTEESSIPLTLNYSQESISSPDPTLFPYALRVTVTPNRRNEGTSLVLIFDGPVKVPMLRFSCMECGTGRINDASGAPDEKTVWAFWNSPPFMPNRPAVFIVQSEHQVRLINVAAGPKSPF